MFYLILLYLIIYKVITIIIFIKTNKTILLAENHFLRIQLEIVQNQKPKQKYRSTIFQKMTLSLLYKALKKGAKNLLYIFKPETLLKWYRNIVKKFWAFPSSKNNVGRPPITQETIDLIIRIKRENPDFGCRKIHGVLKDREVYVCKSKIAEILIQHGLAPNDFGLTWSKFIKSHINSLFGIDAKTVTTLFGTTLYIFFFISYKTRKIHHFNITANPTVKWLEQQLSNFTYDLDKKVYLIRDGDQIYKYVDFEKYDIKDVRISYQAPNMNAVTERFIGSFNREALNKFIIFNENQLRNIVKEYVTYYNLYRPHQGIGNVIIPKYENKNEIKIFHKKPKAKILRKQFLGGLLNYYYYEDAA